MTARPLLPIHGGTRAQPYASLLATLAAAVALGFAIALNPISVVVLAALLLLTFISVTRPWAVLGAVIWYIAIIDRGPEIGGIPAKVPIVLLALALWLSRRRQASYSFAVPVAALGLLAPVAWSAVALLRPFDSAAAETDVTDVVQHASRFIYVLLYFPLVDLMRRLRPERSFWVWLAPVLVICGLTWLLWLGHLWGGLDYPSGKVLFFSGNNGNLPQGYRLYFGNHLLLIPAAALFCAFAMSERGVRRMPWLGGLAVVAITAYMSQTRGVYLGIGTALVVVALLGSLRASGRAAALAVVALLVIVPASPLWDVITQPDRAIASDAIRYEQAPVLLQAFSREPIIGAGLGASLASGYVRDATAPWAFELVYLQTLFQMGIVGLLLLLLVPARGLARILVGIRSLGGVRLALAYTAAGGLVGLMVTAGTNPYLFTAYGMLTLAAMLACAEVALEDRRGPVL